MTLGQKLYDMRKATGLSQERAAEQLGVTRQTVSKWETDQTTPDFDKIIPICKLYKVSSSELFGEEIKESDKTAGDNTQVPSVNEGDILLKVKYKKKFATLLSVAVCLYIMSVIPFILLKGSKVSIIAFFVMIAVATMLIVFGAVSKPKFEDEKPQTQEESLVKRICSIVSGIILVIYLLVSFITGAWYITWILWIVYAIICEIVKLVFSLKGESGDEKD